VPDTDAPPRRVRPRRIPAYRLRMMIAVAVVILIGFMLGVVVPAHG